jgi:PPM family protein phosphatase
MSALQLDIAGESHVGLVRTHNEDTLLVATLGGSGFELRGPTAAPGPVSLVERDDAALLVVADGVGGSSAGELASLMAVQALHELLQSSHKELVRPESVRHLLREAVKLANDRLNTYARDHELERGMATTATTVLLIGGTAHIAQVGDSRVYLVREGMGQQVTKDQSLVQKLVDAGELTAEEAERSDRRNIILQAVGGGNEVEPAIGTMSIEDGDTLVLCSDGLSGLLSTAEIAQVVIESASARAACHAMVGQALERGAPDNVTVLVARVLNTARAPKRSTPMSLTSVASLALAAVILAALVYYYTRS